MVGIPVKIPMLYKGECYYDRSTSRITVDMASLRVVRYKRCYLVVIGDEVVYSLDSAYYEYGRKIDDEIPVAMFKLRSKARRRRFADRQIHDGRIDVYNTSKYAFPTVVVISDSGLVTEIYTKNRCIGSSSSRHPGIVYRNKATGLRAATFCSRTHPGRKLYTIMTDANGVSCTFTHSRDSVYTKEQSLRALPILPHEVTNIELETGTTETKIHPQNYDPVSPLSLMTDYFLLDLSETLQVSA